jgi:hypothetical protein
MAEMGKGLRAYVTVRQVGKEPARVDCVGAVALCKGHAKIYEEMMLNGAPPSPRATVRLVAHRPDIDEELKRAEGAGRGTQICALCSHTLNWKPSGRGVAMADLDEGAAALPAAAKA